MKNKKAKIDGSYYYDTDAMIEQLEQYKQIEKELGIGLITLFKCANADTLYTTIRSSTCCSDGVIRKAKSFSIDLKEKIVDFHYYNRSSRHIPLSEYGKTLAMTKEELEK